MGWAAPDGAAGAYRAWWRSTATGGARLVAGHTASSTGHRDAWGVAPVRHLSGSGQRSPQAVNFMRDRREIRFSGPATVWPWADGVQDRLSVLWQWQALLWARPEGAEGAKGGAPLPVWVAGPRGDLQLWVLQWVGTVQAHDDQGRPLRAQHWRRQATARHDLQFDVGFSDGPEPEPLWLRWAQEGPTSVPLWAWDPQRWPADWVRAQNTTMSGAPLR